MLIIDTRKDYYDCVAGTMGIDKTLVFQRKSEEIKIKIPDCFYRISHCRPYISKKLLNASCFIVGFCGKSYIGFEIEIEKDDKIITYDKELVMDFFNLNDKNMKNNFKRFINYYNDLLKINFEEIYRNHNTPVFIISSNYNNHNTCIEINANLGDYEFYKVFNSFDAFQEIGMFIGGVLGRSENSMVNISNSDRIKQYGFDKFSFGKEKK